MRSFRQVHHLLETLTIPTRITESGVAGADRISRADMLRVKDTYVRTVLRDYPAFISAELTGSFTRPDKQDFGDMDLLVHVRGENKADAKKALAEYLMTFPETVFGVFRNPKYVTKRVYVSGETVSVRYLYDRNTKSVQIDHTVVLSEAERDFKKRFLDFPAEKQGLILGLVKVATREEDPVAIFRRLGIRISQEKRPEQEWEFTLDSMGLTLRLVTLNDQQKEIAREDVWKSDNWSYVEKLLASYDLSLSFEELYPIVKTSLKHPTSKRRIVGLFQAQIRVKSGEVGTEKGAKKLRDIDKMAALLEP